MLTILRYWIMLFMLGYWLIMYARRILLANIVYARKLLANVMCAVGYWLIVRLGYY